MQLLILLPYCIFHSISHHIANVVPNTVAVVAMFVCVYSCIPRLARVAIVASQGGQGTGVARQNAHDGSTSATARISLQFNPKAQSTIPPHLNMFIVMFSTCASAGTAPRKATSRSKANVAALLHISIFISLPNAPQPGYTIAFRPDAAFRDYW